MTIINCFIVFITKLIIFILNKLGKKAGTLPGRIALILNKNIRDFIKFDGKLIVVTGTNGKTTTTNMIYNILSKSNKNVVCNINGNNIDWGITTTLIKNCTLTGKINADYLLLETDEHYVPVIYKNDNLKIDTLIILNFFRDQLDRAGEIETIVLKLESFLKAYSTNLILNGNDPNVVRLGDLNKKSKSYYYGIDKQKESYTKSHDKKEGIICPKCKRELKYEFYQYSHIGKFICPICKFGNVKLDTMVSNIEGNAFYVKNEKYITNNPNLYNIYNLLSIITLGNLYDIDTKIIKEVFKSYESKNGRHQTFVINNRRCILNLCKNPTGFNVILRNIKNDLEKKELLIILNDNENDGKDVSWIYDVNFKDMNSFSKIYCSGIRAYDMAITIKCNGYDESKIIVEHDIKKAINMLIETKNQKYIISNYSALTKTKEYLEQLEGDNE